jgi:hypothetical protein
MHRFILSFHTAELSWNCKNFLLFILGNDVFHQIEFMFLRLGHKRNLFTVW